MAQAIWRQERDKAHAAKRNGSRNGGPLKRPTGRRSASWHPKFDDPVTVGPFVVWTYEMERKLELEYPGEGDGSHGLGPLTALCGMMGWTELISLDSAHRRLRRYREGEQLWVERIDVLEWLQNADAPWWDLYAEPGEELPARHEGQRIDWGRSYNMTEDQIREAHAMHIDGMSMREIGREMWERTYYASPRALANSLTQLFRARDLWIRPRDVATALSNRQRAWRPRCSHVYAAGRKKDTRCHRRCVGNDLTCWKHDPDRIAAAIERLRGRPRQAA